MRVFILYVMHAAVIMAWQRHEGFARARHHRVKCLGYAVPCHSQRKQQDSRTHSSKTDLLFNASKSVQCAAVILPFLHPRHGGSHGGPKDRTQYSVGQAQVPHVVLLLESSKPKQSPRLSLRRLFPRLCYVLPVIFHFLVYLG